MKKVIIADAHPIISKGISGILEDANRAYSIVATVMEFTSLSSKLSSEQPDILILDIDLPGLEGLASLNMLRQHYPKTRILIFSLQPEELYALSTIREGASGYISKTSSLDLFKTALEQVAHGGIFVSDKINGNAVSKSNEVNDVVSRFMKLSSREAEVLDLINKGKRNKTIAEILDINEKTVSTYKSRLLKKLNVDNVAGLIKQSQLLQLSS